MRSKALRWLAAAALAPGVVAALWFVAGEREFFRPARGVPSAERLSGSRLPSRHPERSLTLETARRAERGAARRGAGRGLGARLVESGRPRGPLVPLETKRHLSTSAPGRAGAGGLPLQAAPGGKASAAARARAARAAALSLPADYAPKRRRIPVAASPKRNATGALLPPGKVPRLGPIAPSKLPAPAAKPAAERGSPIGPPKGAARLPAPVVPLEAGK